MYKIIWKKNENLVKLVENENEDLLIVPPRLVYSDELKLLGFDNHFSIPKENGIPICWAIERKYFYKSIVIAEVKKAIINESPVIEFYNTEIKRLSKINIEKLLLINSEQLCSIENEAMDFVKFVFDKYSKKVDSFVCAFSGGKDSQINLDIVSRVLNPKDYLAVFTDTGMELPCTIETINQTREKYYNKFSDFKLYHAKSEVSAISQWEKIGPPSRFSRWCCSVRKTGLFTRTMKSILNTEKQPRIVVFEGVRSAESVRRGKYERIAPGVKHVNLINCRPIFSWNVTEIFLYALKNNVNLNDGYKKGLTRIGCNICPFASSWSESLISILYPNFVKPYIDVVKKMAQNLGLNDENKIDEYIISGNWKKNAGGRGLLIDNSRVVILSRKPNLDIVVNYPKSEWKIWFNILGNYIYTKKGNKYNGEIKIEGIIYSFELEERENLIHFIFSNIGRKISIIGMILKAINKICYCEKCGVCEAECPTGALIIRPNRFEYRKEKCTHCMNCINIHGTGCIVAGRRKISEGGNMNTVRTSGIDRYSTFGLREEWVDTFFRRGKDYFLDYGHIGSKMVQAVNAWLREAELIDSKVKQITELMECISTFYNTNKKIAWELIWINLAFNSVIINTYIRFLDFNTSYSKNDIVEQLKIFYPRLGENTLRNPVDALFNMMKLSPFGHESTQNISSYNIQMGLITKVGKEQYITKIGNPNASKLSICYLLYKIAELEGNYEFVVSDFYNDSDNMGPFKMFYIPRDKFESALISLSTNGYLDSDLAAGLENIHLKQNISPKDILKRMINEL